jgi:hypothetical protein
MDTAMFYTLSMFFAGLTVWSARRDKRQRAFEQIERRLNWRNY